MDGFSWSDVVNVVSPHVVRVETPQSSGTGFLLWQSAKIDLCAVATAAHVVEYARYWNEPLLLHHPDTRKHVELRLHRSHIYTDKNSDTAAIFIKKDALPLPERPLNLADNDDPLPPGADVGWLGFPSVALQTLCFFSGRVSAWVSQGRHYLVDGVAINGVSGGPGLCRSREDGSAGFCVMGLVTGYWPNRATGEALPGLSHVRDVTGLRGFVNGIQSLEDLVRTPEPERPPSLRQHGRGWSQTMQAPPGL